MQILINQRMVKVAVVPIDSKFHTKHVEGKITDVATKPNVRYPAEEMQEILLRFIHHYLSYWQAALKQTRL